MPELKIDESIGIKAVLNPTVSDMVVYLRFITVFGANAFTTHSMFSLNIM